MRRSVLPALVYSSVLAGLSLVYLARGGQRDSVKESGPQLAAASQRSRSIAGERDKPATKLSSGKDASESLHENLVTSQDYDKLLGRKLAFPVPAVGSASLVDTFSEERSGRRAHEAIDIIAPQDAVVVAVDDGVIRKLFTSKLGGITLYHFDPAEEFIYYYAHLDRYAQGMREGMRVDRGDVLGYVGMTGNARTPHLHFAILKMGAEKKWSDSSRALNPYRILRP